MISKEEVLIRIREAMVELFELDPEAITPEAHLVEDLDLDSIDAIDMASRLQQITSRRVPEETLKSIRTVADVVDFVHAELAAKDAARGGG